MAKILSPKSIAEALDMHPKHVYRMISSGVFPLNQVYKIGKSIRVDERAIAAFLKERRVGN